jgi:hypothetical protein
MADHSHSHEHKQAPNSTEAMNNTPKEASSGIANVGDRAFHTSTNIMQLQRALGNKAVLQLMKSRSHTQQAPIQRQITYKDADDEEIAFPNTWKQLMNALEDMPKNIKKLTKSLITELRNSITDEINEKTFEKAWSRVAKDKDQNYDLETQSDKIVEDFKIRYDRSSKAKENFIIRSGDTNKIAEELVKEDSSLKFKGGARNPMVTSKKLEEFSYDKATSKESQIQTQIATVMFNALGSKGEEVQSSLAKDKSNLMISTNLNSTNETLGKHLQDQQSLKSTAKELLIGRGIKDMSREDAMNDRLIRHAMKMFDRIDNFLSEDATVTIPKLKIIQLDGRHAEIRIEESNGWDEKDYFLPTGTMYPCMGCKLYFDTNDYDTGVTMGPLWLTNSSLSTQMELQLKEGLKLGTLGDKSEDVAKLIVQQYQALSDGIKMGWGKKKEGGFTLDHQADSESELDEEDFKRVKSSVLSDEKKRKNKEVYEDIDEDSSGPESDVKEEDKKESNVKKKKKKDI